MRLNSEKIGEVIAEIAMGEIAPRFNNLQPDEIREKSSASDLVTIVDEATEKALSKALKSFYPAATVIGEEGVAANPELGDQLTDEGAYWIIDPLDGTRNFVRGEPEFGTIVALVENGETRMGWIFAVPEEKCAIAELGGGAFWGNEKLNNRSLGYSVELCGLRSVGWLEPAWRDLIDKNMGRHFDTEAGHCSAYAYLRIARGKTDFKISSRIHPWDHAAGALLVAEAGGRTAYLDKEDDYKAMPSVDRPLLCVGDARRWTEVAKLLKETD